MIMNDNEMGENPAVGNGAGSGSGSAGAGAGDEKKSKSKTALSDSDNEKEKTAGSEDRSISASMEGSVEEVEVDAETGTQENNHTHEKLANANGVTEGFGKDVEAPAPVSVLSTPAANANAVPNGGLTAWLQVLGSFFLMMNCWGILNTFGIYQTFYSTPSSSSSPLNRPPTSTSTSPSPSSISWIGSTQAFLLLFTSALTGPLFDAGYFRHLLATGSFLIVFGMVMTSVASRYWEVMLAQAVCVGLGAGCLFVPGVSILPTYFSSRKAVATGVATSGSSLGGILYPIIFYKLEPRIGFGWATRVIAFIALATLSISAATMRVRVLPPAKRRLFLYSAWKDPPYTLFTLGLVCSFVGFYFPMFYIQTYAITNHITDASLGFYLLVILNAASLFGRIVPNLLADRYGPLNVIAPAAVIAAVLAFAWMGIRDTAGLVVFAILYGFSSGCFVSIPPTVIVTLTKNMSEIGTRIGMNVAAAGFGVLIGNPIAGHLVQRDGFEAGMVFCAAIVAVGALLMVVARFAKTGYRVRVIA